MFGMKKFGDKPVVEENKAAPPKNDYELHELKKNELRDVEARVRYNVEVGIKNKKQVYSEPCGLTLYKYQLMNLKTGEVKEEMGQSDAIEKKKKEAEKYLPILAKILSGNPTITQAEFETLGESNIEYMKELYDNFLKIFNGKVEANSCCFKF
jgi:hypothetical protein